MRGVRPALRRGLGLAAGLAAAALAFEFIARQIFWLPYIQDPRLSTILPAGTVARFCREGCARTNWVADGVRRHAALDPALPALLVLGDSFTESLMIDDAHVYTRGLERALEGTDPPIQVWNMGRSGASPAEYAAFAPWYAERVAPRWTVIQLRGGGLETNAFRPGMTRFERLDDGTLGVVEVPPQASRWNALLTPLRRHSAFASLATTRLKEFRAAAAAAPPLFRGGHAAEARTQGPALPPIADALETLARAYDGRVTFFFIPPFDPADPVTPAPAERIFDATCAARAWSCVNLREAYPDFAARHESPMGFPSTRFNWGHMNDAGHVASGALLGAEVSELRSRGLF